jgi:hypothetical protein
LSHFFNSLERLLNSLQECAPENTVMLRMGVPTDSSRQWPAVNTRLGVTRLPVHSSAKPTCFWISMNTTNGYVVLGVGA